MNKTSSLIDSHFLNGCPGGGVVCFAVALVEGGRIGDGALTGTTGEGVVNMLKVITSFIKEPK